MSVERLPEEILREFRRTGHPIQWPVTDHWKAAAAVVYRNRFAENLARLPAPDIASSYAYLSKSQMGRLLSLALRHVSDGKLKGIGIELGAGCGLLSSVVAKRRGVEAVLAVELCEQMATLVISKVTSWVLGERADKVVPIVGSFDNLRLLSDSVDFAVEFDSLHHSDDLAVTLRECARVLKRGGHLLCFDRCHPNSVRDEEVERMLSEVYSRDFLLANAYPPDIALTRRANGEHEYRLFEWEAAFQSAGLAIGKTVRFAEGVSLRHAIKGALSVLPSGVRRLFYQTDNAGWEASRRWLAQRLSFLRRSGEQIVLAPRETTVFCARKI